jgi:hypothetical protein
MVYKNGSTPQSAEETATVVPDLRLPDSSLDDHDLPISVTNAEMEEHAKIAPAGAMSESTGRGALVQPADSMPKPGDKYLPKLDIDFGYDLSAGGAEPWFQEKSEGNPLKARTSAEEGMPIASPAAGNPVDSDGAPNVIGDAADNQAVVDDEAPNEVPNDAPNKVPAQVQNEAPNEVQTNSPAVETADAAEECDANEICDAPEVMAEPTMTKHEIKALAGETLKSPEVLAAFEKNVDDFEKRAESDGLSNKDREEFYSQVGRVLTESKTGNKFYDSKDLQTIASDMMRQGARPGDVNQGATSTCTAAALETVLYIQEPATMGRVVADIATSGEYQKVDGTVVKVPEKNLHPNKYQESTPAEKKRSLASHIAQPALINIHWSGQTDFFGTEVDKGSIVYEEGHATEFLGDAHTRMMDYSKKPPKALTETVSISDPTMDIVGVYGEETQPLEGPNMHMEFMQGLYKQLRGNKGDLTIISGKEGDGVIKPSSREEFDKALKAALDRKKPVLLGVHANRDPFLEDLNDSYSREPLTEQQRKDQSRMHAHHALVATGVDTSGLVTVENQWGNSVDHTGEKGQKPKLSLDTVYDTVRVKDPSEIPAAAEPEVRKKPTGEDHIKQQKKFVEELEKDPDVKSETMLHERMKLMKYQKHWGHTEDAQKQLALIAKHLETQWATGKVDDSLRQNTANFMSYLKDGANPELAKNILKAADEHFKKKPTSDFNYEAELSKQLEYHNKIGDQAGAKELVHAVVSQHLKEIIEPDGLPGERRLNDLVSISDALDKPEFKDERARISAGLLKDIRDYEKAHGTDTEHGLRAKQSVLFFGDKDTDVELKTKMAGEIRESYDRMMKKGDLTSEAAMTARYAMRLFYEQRRNPEGLNEMIQDTFKANSISDRKGNARALDSKDNLGMYEYGAESLNRIGGCKYAVPLLEKGLEIAKKHDPDRVERLAYSLVNTLDKLGRSDEGDKIAKELGIEILFRTRKTANATSGM